MTNGLQIYGPGQAQAALGGGRQPMSINKRTGRVTLHRSEDGLRVNSILLGDEWKSLDTAVVMTANQRLRGIQHLKDRGLVKNEGSIGVTLSQWNTASEMTAADVNMSGRTAVTQDRVEFSLAGVPLPVIAKQFVIGERELAASRMAGASLDTSNAEAASNVVAEKLEQILFLGHAGIVFQGSTIYGYTTHPNRNTDTAGNYGGGDWGTVGNAEKTIGGMIAALHADNMFGPYVVYASPVQYGQAGMIFNTDGSGDTGVDRITRLPGIEGVYPGEFLTAGEVVVVQMTRNVVDLAYVPGYEMALLEWASGDGFTNYFKVVSIQIPRIKADFGTRSGISHATGA